MLVSMERKWPQRGVAMRPPGGGSRGSRNEARGGRSMDGRGDAGGGRSVMSTS